MPSATLSVPSEYAGVRMEENSTLHLTAAVTHESDWYVARCLDVEVASQGVSVEEALANLREALELYFEDHEAVDVATHPIVAPIEISVPTAA